MAGDVLPVAMFLSIGNFPFSLGLFVNPYGQPDCSITCFSFMPSLTKQQSNGFILSNGLFLQTESIFQSMKYSFPEKHNLEKVSRPYDTYILRQKHLLELIKFSESQKLMKACRPMLEKLYGKWNHFLKTFPKNYSHKRTNFLQWTTIEHKGRHHQRGKPKDLQTVT